MAFSWVSSWPWFSRGRCCGSWSARTREKKKGKALFAIDPFPYRPTPRGGAAGLPRPAPRVSEGVPLYPFHRRKAKGITRQALPAPGNTCRVGKAHTPGTPRPGLAIKSRGFRATEPNAAFDPACPRRAAAAINGFSREFAGNHAPGTRRWTARSLRPKASNNRSGRSSSNPFPQPRQGCRHGLTRVFKFPCFPA